MTSVQTHTLDAFLDWEPSQVLRHEFVDGDVRAMAGAGRRHEDVAGALFSRIATELLGTTCKVYKGDFAVRIEAANCYYYPDVHVSCDPRDTDEHSNAHPRLVIEVLSAATAEIDRGEKRLNYQTLAALEEYFVVDPRNLSAHAWRRDADGRWIEAAFAARDVISIASLDLTIDLALLIEESP